MGPTPFEGIAYLMISSLPRVSLGQDSAVQKRADFQKRLRGPIASIQMYRATDNAIIMNMGMRYLGVVQMLCY